MIAASVSPLSLAAAGLYGVVVVAALFAALTALRQGQQPWHAKSWLLLAGLFVLLLAFRVAGLEELLREALRDLLRASSAYEDRRGFQRPLAAGLVILATAAASWWLYRTARHFRGRRNIALFAALASGFVMLFLVALRIISLHPVDSLLYGPLKLNWLTDIGASLLVAGAAAYYAMIVRGRR